MTLRQSLWNLFREANRTLFGWVKDRFPTAPWADMTRKLIETDQRQGHMSRVYFTGAYKKPRELNWIIVVTLLLLALGFGYPGYVQPANNLSDAAATIVINMAKSVPYVGDLQAQLVYLGTDIRTTHYVL